MVEQNFLPDDERFGQRASLKSLLFPSDDQHSVSGAHEGKRNYGDHVASIFL
jgi:hypothetical protein